jgi:hypothetical protein
MQADAGKIFEDLFHRLLLREGGYSDNAADSGGQTKYGITEEVARAHGYTGAMKDLPLSVAQTDTPGAHILTAIVLGIFGVVVTVIAEHYKFTETAKAASTLTGFLSIASYAMRGSGKAALPDPQPGQRQEGEQK